ncbi:MAG TPA: TIM barrel protein [Acidimicrobiales bacterium]|nr:TIM barrel protein [Acidimicrobiales bacterium]
MIPADHRYPLGVHSVAFGPIGARACFERAAALGFDHVDIGETALREMQADGGPPPPLPAGDILSPRGFAPDRTAMAPVLRSDQPYDEIVTLLRAHPGARLEVGPRSVAGSVESIRQLADDVPGLRFTVDTGHIATWGEDPLDVLDLADHVQLRQAAPGRPQLWPDEGVIDFAALIARLRQVDYHGLLTIEYFDLPDYGWPVDDPVGHAVALAQVVRPLLQG